MRQTVCQDGPGMYPRSCCVYTRKRSPDARLMLGRCRQREAFLMEDLRAARRNKDYPLVVALRIRLEEVQAMIVFMDVNCPDEQEDPNGEI